MQEFTIETIRHSFAHVLAISVSRLFPNAKLGIGPAVETGFYYEFEIDQELDQNALALIEEEMQQVISENLQFKQIVISREQAFDTLLQLGQTYKTEILQLIKDDMISCYKSGDEFVDLCRGPHVLHTGNLGSFKLVSIKKVNWLGDHSRPVMYRIQGVAFSTKEELDEYFTSLQELQDSNHIQLGKRLELFYFDSSLSDNQPTWLSKGIVLKEILQKSVQNKLADNNYTSIETPESFISSQQNDILKTYGIGSQYYLHSSTNQAEKRFLRNEVLINHIRFFQKQTRSIKDLPFKLHEFSKVYCSHSKSQTTRLTNTLNQHLLQGTIFCNEDQLGLQIQEIIKINNSVIKDFDFKNISYLYETPRPSNLSKMGALNKYSQEMSLVFKNILNSTAIQYTVEENKDTFPFPRLACVVTDKYDRKWKLTSIYIDNFLSKLFKINYAHQNDLKPLQYIISVQYLSTIEKFIMLLIEHTKGALPIKLSPVQVKVISISKKYNKNVKNITKTLTDNNISTESDLRNITMQNKIRDAQIKQIPYMIVIGSKEAKTDAISVRPRFGQNIGLMRFDDFLQQIKSEIQNQ